MGVIILLREEIETHAVDGGILEPCTLAVTMEMLRGASPWRPPFLVRVDC